MGLKETIKETKEKLEEVVKEEKAEEKSALEALDKAVGEIKEEPKKEELKEEKKPDVKTEEKPKEEPKVEEKEKTPTDYSKERQARKDRLAADLAAAKARIAALEANLKPAEQPKQVTDQEPNKQTNPTEWADWRVRQTEKKLAPQLEWIEEQKAAKSKDDLFTRATAEMAVYEDQLRQSNPDYNEVKDWYGSMLATSIKIVNPDISQPDLVKAVDNRLLSMAAKNMTDGYENPVEPIYLAAKKLGWQPRQKEEPKQEKEEISPDMDKVAQLRKRNAGMAGSGGSGGEGEVTARVAVTMTNREFAKLKPEQKKRLFASLRSAS